jgi:predicted alpha/beta hydrolase family esterase
MPKQASRHVLFVQGGGADTHDAWDDKLVASLGQALGPGYVVHYPRMPDEGNPDAQAWKHAIARELARLEDDVILVGHSIGAAIVLDQVADGDRKRRLAGIFLIAAPYIGDGGWPSDDVRPTSDLAARLPGDVPIHLYHGDDDDTVPRSHVHLFEKALPRATIHRLEGRDHQLNDDLSEVARDIGRLRRRRRKHHPPAARRAV